MTIEFDHRMPREFHVALCNHIMESTKPEDCDHTLKHANFFLDQCVVYTGPDDAADAREWLTEHGGHCDCEIILNTIPWDETNIEPSVETTP